MAEPDETVTRVNAYSTGWAAGYGATDQEPQAAQEDERMSFIDGVLAIAGIGGGRDTTTVSSNGSTVVLALALAGVLVVLIYAGMSVKGKR